MKKNIILQDLGVIDYKEAWDYQENIFKSLVDSKIEAARQKIECTHENYFLYCEHPHVYTLGKSGSEQNMLLNFIQLQAKNAQFYKINRGGDITYHGPGQIVGYPILDLERLNFGIKLYIYNLEEVIIRTIAEFGIKGDRLDGATGVWLDIDNKQKVRKICAIGVRASRQVTMHGFALNVNTDLTYFSHINPCGFTDKAVTSLEKEMGEKQDINTVKQIINKHFEACFDCRLE